MQPFAMLWPGIALAALSLVVIARVAVARACRIKRHRPRLEGFVTAMWIGFAIDIAGAQSAYDAATTDLTTEPRTRQPVRPLPLRSARRSS